MKPGAWLIPMLLLQPSAIPAQEVAASGESPAPPPSYKILRFDENYSCLSNAANRRDMFDPIKYMPLRTNDPNWYLTLGGELRERFEGNHDVNFGIGAGSDSYWLQRATLLGDLYLGERVRIFVEGISGLEAGESRPAPPVQKDPINLQFAFLDVVPYLTDDEKLTLRVGRFGMSFGAGRLVATRAAPNIPFKFDGFEAIYERPFWEATVFVTRPGIESTYHFDTDDNTTAFWGLYLTHWFDIPHRDGLDVYYLGFASQNGHYASGAGDEQRHSFGARWFGEKNQWDWNAEAVAQTGSFANESILAWTAAMDSGYTWNAPWQPRIGLKTGIASGDHNPTNGPLGTFDALYFKSGYFNDASLIRPQNIIGVHPNLGVKPTRSVSVDGGGDVFWRDSRDDAIYAPPGFVAIPASKTASAYVGTALDVNLEWRIQRHISFLASYVHFFTGEYIHAAGGHDVDYVSTTLDFLF